MVSGPSWGTVGLSIADNFQQRFSFRKLRPIFFKTNLDVLSETAGNICIPWTIDLQEARKRNLNLSLSLSDKTRSAGKTPG
jgi:hydroxyacyl-ACP dehydratase HTD2-like protein with hotdog domain